MFMTSYVSQLARHAMTVVVVLTVAGCWSPPKGSELSQQSAYSAANAQDGLVIYGIDINHNIAGAYLIHWQRIDEATKLYRQDAASLRKVSMELSQQFWPHRRPLPRKFFVFRVKPGTYGVKKFENVSEYGKISIRFRARTLAFKIEPGEVLYIGNFHLIWVRCSSFPFIRYCTEKTRLDYGKPSIEEAKAALAKYKNVEGELRYSKLKPFDLD